MQPVGLIGNVSLDVVDGGAPRVGGTVFYGASALRAIGAPARVAASCAAADRAQLMMPLTALGLPLAWRDGGATARFELRYAGSARTVIVHEIGPRWTPSDVETWVERALGRPRWIHVGGLLRDDFPVETLAALARKRRLVVDVQGLARRRRLGPVQLDAVDERALEHVAVLKLAEDEAAALVGAVDERALRELAVPEIVVTLGARGSLVLANGRLEHVPAFAIAADPTGAGDAFTAAYAASRASGLTGRAAARRATAVVADVLRRRRL